MHRGGEAPILVALRDVQKSISTTRDQLTFTADPETLGDAACELAILGAEFDALRLQLLAQAQAAATPSTAGLRTMSQYLAARTGVSPAAVRIDAHVNRWLNDFPQLRDALGHGLTMAHLQYIRRHCDNARSHHDLKADQQFFIDSACNHDFDVFTVCCQTWLVIIDPDGEEPKDQVQNTRLSIRNGHGGRGVLAGEVDAIGHQLLDTAVEHEAAKLHATDKQAGITRTPTQRAMAALIELVQRGFARADGTHPVPLINIVMSQKIAEWARKQVHHATNGPVPVDPFDVDGRCELIDGTPIHPTLALLATGLYRVGTATLRRYVIDAHSRLVDYSANTRSFPEHVRTAAHVRSRGRCDTPGCDAPHHACGNRCVGTVKVVTTSQPPRSKADYPTM